MEAESLKRSILDLLERDREFRLAVAGLLGFSEILKRLEKHDERFNEILEEIRALREEQTRIWREIGEIKDDIRALREEQIRLREEQTRIWREIEALREEQVRLREEQTKIWKEIRSLREDFNRMLRTIEELRTEQRRLERRMENLYEGLSASIMYAFGELSRFAGITFEEFVRRLLSHTMRRSGEIPGEAELERRVIGGEEVDLFFEDPLIVGEVTAHARSAEEEVIKLLRKASKARELFGREPKKILIVQTAEKEVAKRLRELAESEGIDLVIGRVL